MKRFYTFVAAFVFSKLDSGIANPRRQIHRLDHLVMILIRIEVIVPLSHLCPPRITEVLNFFIEFLSKKT